MVLEWEIRSVWVQRLNTKLGDSTSDVVCGTQSSLGSTGLSEDAELCCTWNSPGKTATGRHSLLF